MKPIKSQEKCAEHVGIWDSTNLTLKKNSCERINDPRTIGYSYGKRKKCYSPLTQYTDINSGQIKTLKTQK